MHSLGSWIMVLCCLFGQSVFAQDSLPKRLSEQDFFAIVKSFHPLMRQADIQVQKAKAQRIQAQAGFDPSFYFTNQQKTFDGKQYYQYINTELKIPTWYGIEIKGGTENNRGANADTELTPGPSSYLGISIPLAKNLLMDKRRAALKQAKLFITQTEAERRERINDLLYDAGSSYWNWVRASQVKVLIQSMLQVNRERYELVKIGFRQGDRPALDTTEALSQLQQFEFLETEATLQVTLAAIDLSTYCWKANDTYYNIDETVQPDSTWLLPDIAREALPELNQLLTEAASHPALQQYQQKLSILQIDRKLKFQDLLPTVNVNGTLLSKDYTVLQKLGGNFYENNNKFGLTLGIPLRLSEGRGAYRLAGLKLKETQNDLNLKRQAILNKIQAAFAELAALQKQVQQYGNVYTNYEKLARGESIRFRAGEGTLFLLNSRENKQLEAAQKLIELKTKYYKSKLSLQWSAGLLR